MEPLLLVCGMVALAMMAVGLLMLRGFRLACAHWRLALELQIGALLICGSLLRLARWMAARGTTRELICMPAFVCRARFRCTPAPA